MAEIVNEWYWLIFVMLAWVAGCGSLGAKQVYDGKEPEINE
jgi:hypothetical protein